MHEINRMNRKKSVHYNGQFGFFLLLYALVPVYLIPYNFELVFTIHSNPDIAPLFSPIGGAFGGGFTVKLLKLKLQGPSLAQAPSRASGMGPK
jgi:hypothetical protein